MRIEACADDSAEQLAANAECLAPAQHRTGCLPLERRRIDGALAGDDERCAACALVEARQVEDELGTVEQLRAHRGERRAEPSARARTGQVAVRGELVERREPQLELLDL